MRRILPCSLVLWSMTVAGQSWHIYLTSSTVYDIDISGNNVLVGLDQRVATVNTIRFKPVMNRMCSSPIR